MPPAENPSIGCAAHPRLYDLRTDVGQQRDIATQRTQGVQALAGALAEIHHSMGTRSGWGRVV